jgi:hypothetical protein
MKKHWVVKGIKFALFGVVFATVFSYVVMHLWNWLMPPIFGWHVINFWQAVGLLVLSKILFGGFRGGPGRHWKHRMTERWEAMTPEEREKFREGMRGRCGSFGAGAAEPKA